MAILQPIFSVVIFFLLLFPNHAVAQDSLLITKKESTTNKNLTISYSIELTSNEKDKGIGETYNGGIKTVFISHDKARVRLASLMRIQSVFILPQTNEAGMAAVIVKESGKNKYKSYLSQQDWTKYNEKYDSSTCTLTSDSVTILDYPCRKAIISLTDGRTITAYYTDSIRNSVLAIAEPAFKCVPGVVLKYEYAYKKGTIIYTAAGISTADLSEDVFRIPVKGYAVRKFSFAKSAGTGDNNSLAD
jgi:GLPGLI family protein